MICQGELAECEVLAREILPLLRDREQIRETRWSLYLATMRQNGMARAAEDLQRSLEGPDVDEVDRAGCRPPSRTPGSSSGTSSRLRRSPRPRSRSASRSEMIEPASAPSPLSGSQPAVGARSQPPWRTPGGPPSSHCVRRAVGPGRPLHGMMLIEADELDQAELELRDGRRREHDRGSGRSCPALRLGDGRPPLPRGQLGRRPDQRGDRVRTGRCRYRLLAGLTAREGAVRPDPPAPRRSTPQPRSTSSPETSRWPAGMSAASTSTCGRARSWSSEATRRARSTCCGRSSPPQRAFATT